MFVISGKEDDDKLPSSLLEKLIKEVLNSIKNRCQEYYAENKLDGIFCVTGIPYINTSKIVVACANKEKKAVFEIYPGLLRSDSPQWSICCKVFEDDIKKIVNEEIKDKVINRLEVPIGLIIL